MANHITAQNLLDDGQYELCLKLLAGSEGCQRELKNPRIQKPGLALAGYSESVNPGRLQILGNTEVTYLLRLSGEEVRLAIRRLFNLRICACVITNQQTVPHEVIEEAEFTQTPLFVSTLPTSSCIARLQSFLEDQLQVSTSVHGVLCDVLGVGVLVLGKSGIGKSEAAMELVLRGHHLVADDIVEIKRKGNDVVYGAGSELIKHHMEIRGLGIINIKDMFGVASVRSRKKIELVIELVEWDEESEYERLGIDDQYYEILDVRIPELKVPVRPGRNMAAIIEVAARNHLLKLQGHHAARTFQANLTREIQRREENTPHDSSDEVE